MVFALAVLITALTTPQAEARNPNVGPDSCRFVRLDSRGGSMEHVPLRSQGALGVAYAETTAQMVDAWRFSHGERNTKTKTSSVATALAYGDQLKRERLGNGTACPAPATMKFNSHCAQLKSVESAIAKVGLRNFMRQLDGYFTTYRYEARKEERVAQLSRKRHPAQAEKLADERAAYLAITAREVTAFLRKSGFSKTMIPAVAEVKPLLEQAEGRAFFEGLLHRASAACPSKKNESNTPAAHCDFTPVTPGGQSKEAVSADIRRRLAAPNAQPLGVAYCSEVLHKGRYYRGLASKKARCYKKDDHLSLVIGMRPGFSQGSCQFLVRNSHGEKCDGYSRDWECERGNIWIDSRALVENLKAISTLEPTRP